MTLCLLVIAYLATLYLVAMWFSGIAFGDKSKNP